MDNDGYLSKDGYGPGDFGGEGHPMAINKGSWNMTAGSPSRMARDTP